MHGNELIVLSGKEHVISAPLHTYAKRYMEIFMYVYEHNMERNTEISMYVDAPYNKERNIEISMYLYADKKKVTRKFFMYPYADNMERGTWKFPCIFLVNVQASTEIKKDARK